MLPVGIGARRQGATHRVRVASLKSIVERFVYFRRHLIVGYAARPRPSLKLKIIEQFELQPGPVVARWSLCRVASINDDDLSATRLEESRARISRAC